MSNPSMAAARPALLRRGLLLEYLTVGWNILEGTVAIAAGLIAGSPALVGFGVDSAVETVSGVVLVWRLRFEATGEKDDAAIDRLEARAEQLVGVAFLLLAAYVAFDALSALVSQEAPDASPVGIVLTAVSTGVMLWLARAKRQTGEALRSRALIADSKQTQACWYLSVTALIGLAANAAFGLWWADPIAAVIIVAFLLREGLEAIRGEDDDE
jgi:divalent metal cation (Fe/Co/Zn/Cd) transporter